MYRPHALPRIRSLPTGHNDILRRGCLTLIRGRDGIGRYGRTSEAASSGVADVDAVVLSMQTVDAQDVPANALEGQLGSTLRDQGFDGGDRHARWSRPARTPVSGRAS